MRIRIVAASALASSLVAGAALAEPLLLSSVVPNDLDFITASGPAVPGCLRYLGSATQEMAGALNADELMAAGVRAFEVTVADAAQIGLWAHSSAGTREGCPGSALLVGPPGRLPAPRRQPLSHVVIQSSDEAAPAEHPGHFFAACEDNVRARIGTHDPEEAVFHEPAHAMLDATWAQGPAWLNAQAADDAFVTEHAAEDPQGWDLAESALVAFASEAPRAPASRGGLRRRDDHAGAAGPPGGCLRCA